MNHVREVDVDFIEMNGIPMVVPNGRGISLMTEDELRIRRFTGWAWKIPQGTKMPESLALHSDRPGHFMVCPVRAMSLPEYRKLLADLALTCTREMKLPIRKVSICKK